MIDTAGQIALTAWLIVIVVPMLISIFGDPVTSERVKIATGLVFIVAGVVAFSATITWIWS